MSAEWLLCDYGLVLSQPPPPEDLETLAALTGDGAGPGDFGDGYWRHRPAYDRADTTAAEFWEAVAGRPLSGSALQRLVEVDTRMWLHVDDDAVSAAIGAAGRGFRLALLSNAPVEVAAAIDRLEVLAPFEPRFFSCDLRSVKPEPEAYNRVLETLGAAPDEVLFFDDRPANVDAAAAIGIRAELFESPRQIESAAVRSGSGSRRRPR